MTTYEIEEQHTVMFIYDHILAYDIIECYQNILYVCLPRNSKSARKTNIESREQIWPWLRCG